MASMKKKKQTKVTKKKIKNVFVDRSELEAESSLAEMIRGFSDRQQQTDQLLSSGDAGRGGSVNMEDSELGLMKLGIPRQPSQLHMLTQQLQTSNNINYHDFIRRIQTLRTEGRTQMSEDFVKTRGAAEVQSESCLGSQHQPNPENHSSFIHLNVRLIPFDAAVAHPRNFEVVLLSRSRVFSLIRIIQDHVRIPTCRLEVFRSKVLTEEVRLNPESSLEECGLKGGPEKSPPEATVYYNYTLLFTDCPILNCDHYFRSKLKSST